MKKTWFNIKFLEQKMSQIVEDLLIKNMKNFYKIITNK